MDALRIERAVLLRAPPTYGSFRSTRKREKTGESDEAAAKPGEADGSGKPESVPITHDTAVRISYDKDIGHIVVKVLDKESAMVVRQLPSEETVAFFKQFHKAVALLVDTTI